MKKTRWGWDSPYHPSCGNLRALQLARKPKKGRRAVAAGSTSRVTRTGGTGMKRNLCGFAAASPLLLVLAASPAAVAQKQGGTLTIGHFDSPASVSPLEESTNAVNRPMMGVFNN